MLAGCAVVSSVCASAESLRSISDLRRMEGWSVRTRHPLALVGTLTWVDVSRRLIVVQDETGAVAIRVDLDDFALPVGSKVEVTAADSWPNLAGIPEFPYGPSGHELLTSFEAPSNWGYDYVSRVRGLLYPPTTGDYQFWIASDDSSELWLGTSDSRDSAQRIATVSSWSKPREWRSSAEQRSALIHLEAGKAYYIEALHQQSAGVDHLAVAWEGPGIPQQVIDGAYLSPGDPEEFGDAPFQNAARPPAPRGALLREYWLRRSVDHVSRLSAPRRLESMLIAIGSSIRALDTKGFPAPEPIRLGEHFSPTENFEWRVVEANIDFVAQRDDGYAFELVEGGARAQAVVRGLPEPVARALRGRRARLTGVVEGAFSASGDAVMGVIWAPTASCVTRVEQSADVDNRRLSPIAELLASNPQSGRNRVVKVRGRVEKTTAEGRLRLVDNGAFYGYLSTDGSQWKSIGGPVELPVGAPLQKGLAISSRSAETPAAAEFDHVGGLAGDAKDTPVGDPSGPRRLDRNADRISLSSAGRDVWAAPDQFYFVHQPFEGATEITARVTKLTANDGWAKAGLMIRAGLSADAPFIDLVQTGSNGCCLQWRKGGEGNVPLSVNETNVQPPVWLKLTRRFSAIEVIDSAAGRFKAGEQVEAIGYLETHGGALVVADASCRRVGAEAELAGRSEDSSPLVDLAHVRSAPGDTDALNSLKVRGVVTFAGVVGGKRYVAIQDQSGAALVSDSAVSPLQRPRFGSFVEIQSNPGANPPTTKLVAAAVSHLGAAALPPPMRHPAEYALPLRGEGAWVEIEGIVRSVAPNGLLQVNDSGDQFTVGVMGGTAKDFQRLVDAKLRIRGAIAYPAEKERLLLVPSRDHIEVVETPDLDPFAGPIERIEEFNVARLRNQSLHRVVVRGVVTFVDAASFYVQDETGGARVEWKGAPAPELGATVQVAGFPDLAEDESVTFSHAVFRPSPALPPVMPRAISADDLLRRKVGAQLAVVKATFSRDIVVDGQHTIELQFEERMLRASLAQGSLPLVPPGAIVQVTGVCVLEPSATDEVKHSRASLVLPARLLLRSTDDFAVLQTPRWWAVKRTLAFVSVAVAALLVFVFWIYALRRRVAQRTAELRATMEKLKQETQAAATLAERNRLAGEIHDSLEQGFSGLILQLDSTAKRPNCPPEVRAGLAVARNMVAFSRNEVRHAVWDLHSPILEQADLGAALKAMVEQLAPENTKTTVMIEGPSRRLSSATEHHVLRIAQEAITNSLKHAKASRLDLKLSFSAEQLILTVADDGQGFDPNSVMTNGVGHFGLRSLRGRASKIQGQLKIVSQPGQGATIELRVPITS